MKHLIAALGIALLGSPALAATVDIAASERGGDVILAGSGSIDLSGGLFAFTTDLTAANGSNQFYLLGSSGNSDVYAISPISGRAMSSGAFQFMSSGDNFGFDFSFGALALNEGYTSGSSIDFVWTVAGTTIDALGLNFGVLGNVGTNTVTLTDERYISEVPLPASAVLLLAGLGGLSVASRKKKA